MDAIKAMADLTTQGGTADQQVAWANETVYRPKTWFISYRTLRADVAFGKAVADAIAAALANVDPNGRELFMQAGNNKGDAGGVDVSLPETAGMIAQMQAGGVITADHATALLDLGRTSLGSLAASAWGVTAADLSNAGSQTFDAVFLAKIPGLAAVQTLSNAVRPALTLIDFDAATAATLLGLTTDAVATKRAALVTLVQTYLGKANAGQDISGIPTTLAAAWGAA